MAPKCLITLTLSLWGFFLPSPFISAQQNNYLDNLFGEVQHITYCNPESLDDFFQQYYFDVNKPLNSVQLDSLETYLLNLTSSCESSDVLERIIRFNIFTSSSDVSHLSFFQELELLTDIESLFLSSSEVHEIDYHYLYKLYTHFISLYHNNGRFEKASQYAYKALDYIKPRDEEYINALQSSIRSRLALQANDEVLEDLHTCLNHYSTYPENLYGPFYCNRIKMGLIRYFNSTGLQDSAAHYLKIIDQNTSTFYSYSYENYLSVKADYHGVFNEHREQEESLLELRDFLKDQPSSLRLDLRIAEFYLDQEDHARAKENYEKVLQNIFIRIGDLDEVINESVYISTLIGMSSIAFAENDFSYKDSLLKARRYIKIKFSSMGAQKEKIKLLENHSDMFSLIFRYADQLGFSDEELLEFSEEARSYTLLDEIQQEHQLKEQLSETDYDQFKKLSSQVLQINEKIKTHRDIPMVELSNLTTSRSRNIQGIDSIKALTKTNAITSVDLSNLYIRDGNTTVLEYYVADSSCLVFVLNKEDVSSHQIHLSSEDLEAIASFKKSIADDRSPKYMSLGQQLYQLIIGPIESELKEKLIIIPHGAISSIPFDALIDEKGNYLIQDKIISYAYSLRVLQEMRSIDVASDQFLGYAPSYQDCLEDYNVPPLRHNLEEINNAAQFFPNSKLLLGKSASKYSFIQDTVDKAIIHIAAHADVDPDDDDNSFIAFSDATCRIDSTLLFLPTLYALDLNTEMIVLSACNTGIGKYAAGEGILSLARGFVHAGTGSVVSSLWPINDKYSKELMESFYSYLEKGHAKDYAIAIAKRDFLKKYENSPTIRHPNNWAGFILIGDAAPIFDNNGCYLYCILIILGLVLLISSIAFLRKRQS